MSQAELKIPLLQRLVPYALLTLAVFGVYANIYDNVFLFDDNLLIQINDNLRSFDHILEILTGSTTSGAHIAGGFYRPLQMLLYLLAYQLGFGAVFPFHLLNVTLHATNACLVYRLGQRLSFKRVPLFAATLIWALHPLHTEAITYMSGTADPLYCLFLLLALDILLPTVSLRKVLAITPLFILGLLSKETAIIFAPLVLVCQFYLAPQKREWRLYVVAWPLWIITLIYALVRLQAPGFDGPHSYATVAAGNNYSTFKLYVDHLPYRISTCLATLPSYLALLAWPTGLHMERLFPIYTNPFAMPVLKGFGLLCLALASIARVVIKNGPSRGAALAWGLLWFMAAYAPDSGILWPMNSLFLEHWMYVPTIGLFLGSAQTLAVLLDNQSIVIKRACLMLAALFALNLGIKTFMQNEIWSGPFSFYANILAHNDRSARAHNNLALYYTNQGKARDAILEYQRAINASDIYAETHYNLALTYLHLPDADAHIEDAREQLNRALQIDPHFYRAWIVLADLADHEGDSQKAAAYRARASQNVP